jgi:hypothetical protein
MEDDAVGSTNRLQEGLAILRAIVRSDAVRDVRQRVRQGAMVIADSGRVPRLVAVGAGVVAALLDEPAGVYRREQEAVSGVDSWSVDETEAREDLRDAWRFEHEDDRAGEPDDEVDLADQETATLRDLQGEQDLEEQLLGATDAEREEEDGELRLLRFEADEVAGERPDDGDDAPGRQVSDSRGQGAPQAQPAERTARTSRKKQGKAAKPKGAKAPAPKARQPKRAPKTPTVAPKSPSSAPVRRSPRKK